MSRRRLYLVDSEDTLEVIGACRVCKLPASVILDDGEPFLCVVSPAGIAHHANEYGDTDCGHDATRDGWWWP